MYRNANFRIMTDIDVNQNIKIQQLKSDLPNIISEFDNLLYISTENLNNIIASNIIEYSKCISQNVSNINLKANLEINIIKSNKKNNIFNLTKKLSNSKNIIDNKLKVINNNLDTDKEALELLIGSNGVLFVEDNNKCYVYNR
jgi:hypothetical protein